MEREHRVCLYRIGGLTIRARTLRDDVICENAEIYWMGTGIGDMQKFK